MSRTAQDIDGVLAMLEFSPDKFGLFLVVSPDQASRELWQAVHHRAMPCIDIALHTPEQLAHDLLSAVGKPGLIWIGRAPSSPGHSVSTTLIAQYRGLNQSRGWLEKTLKRPVFLCLSDQEYEAFRLHAPDLWVVRQFVFQCASPTPSVKRSIPGASR